MAVLSFKAVALPVTGILGSVLPCVYSAAQTAFVHIASRPGKEVRESQSRVDTPHQCCEPQTYIFVVGRRSAAPRDQPPLLNAEVFQVLSELCRKHALLLLFKQRRQQLSSHTRAQPSPLRPRAGLPPGRPLPPSLPPALPGQRGRGEGQGRRLSGPAPAPGSGAEGSTAGGGGAARGRLGRGCCCGRARGRCPPAGAVGRRLGSCRLQFPRGLAARNGASASSGRRGVPALSPRSR